MGRRRCRSIDKRHQLASAKGLNTTGLHLRLLMLFLHMSELQDSPKPWISNGEMLIARWPGNFAMEEAFPPLGAEDCLGDLHDEFAVQGAHFTTRAERKRKKGDGLIIIRFELWGLRAQ